MKLKLLIASIFILFIFVAYRQYRDFSSLKSINSYQSCVSAEGSIIQESYPSICLTKTGESFRQELVAYSPVPLSDDLAGFSIKVNPGLTRQENIIFGRKVILYCGTMEDEESNVCNDHGISISVYDQPEFGGSCYDFDKNIDLTKKITLGNIQTTYCEDKESLILGQMFIDRSAQNKNSYSILAKYSKDFTKEQIIQILSTFKFTD